jgi:tRNA(Ile)-lysidine synthase
MKYSTLKPMTLSSPLRFSPEWVDDLFMQAKTVWVGFSGGVDSHVLLHLLVSQLTSEQKQKLVAIHVHHGLSTNADNWLKHCESICNDLGVNFVAEYVQLEVQASLEDAARNARYHAFQKNIGNQGVILLAHHAGDQAETVLFRLLRGTGGKGLVGIPEERSLGEGGAKLIRPLLYVSKAEIESYAQQQQLDWIQDESNSDERFTRNFLRQRVVPILKERFPKMEQNIASSAQRIATDYSMLAEFASMQLDVWCNDFGGLKLSFIADKVRDERLFWLRQFLQRKGTSLTHSQLESIDDMFASGEDKQPEFVFSTGRLMRHRNIIYLLPLDQVVVLASLASGEVLKRPFDEIRVRGSNNCALKVRPEGVTLIMFNGKTRKLKKWLNDQQVPSWWREHLPYIYQGDTLIAIGDLWRRPGHSHLDIEWRINLSLPLPK